MKYFDIEQMKDIVYGSAFFGGGGGGSLIEGMDLIEELEKEFGKDVKLKMIDVDEMEDDENVVSVMVAALGSPEATKGMLFIDEAMNAVKGMEREAAAQGKKLKYIYSGEQGGGNTMLPLYIAIKLGMTVLDTDANGRAVPELNTGLLPIHDIPTSPVVLASGKGDILTARTSDPMDSHACENIARHMCMAYNMGIGFAAWLANKQDHLNASALGQMTITQKVGKILRDGNPDKLANALADILGKENVFTIVESGRLVKKVLNTEGGFDDGVNHVQDSNGDTITINFQNENLVIFDKDNQAIAAVPDIIAIVDLGNETNGVTVPVSNSETEEGQNVAVFAVRADKRWSDKDGYECWKDVLKEAGYSGERIEL